MNTTDRWNHNIHYHPILLAAVRPGGHVLDVGCGEGMLTRALAGTAASVIGIDMHAPSIELARATIANRNSNVEYICADVLQHRFDPATFDAVVSVATLHHLGTEAGLLRLREWVRPGGTLGIVGLAAGDYPRDLLWDIAGAIGTRVHKLNKRYWEHAAPVLWPPPETYSHVRRIAQRLLPGAQFRRHLLWRYSLVWRKPEAHQQT